MIGIMGAQMGLEMLVKWFEARVDEAVRTWWWW
jgi:hypothetical protein